MKLKNVFQNSHPLNELKLYVLDVNQLLSPNGTNLQLSALSSKHPVYDLCILIYKYHALLRNNCLINTFL